MASPTKQDLLNRIAELEALLQPKLIPSETIHYPRAQPQTVLASQTVTPYEVQARKAGQPFFSEYFPSYQSAFFKVKALQKAGWLVTRRPSGE